MAEIQNLKIGEVNVGDEIPDLVYDCTATTVAFGAIATRDISVNSSAPTPKTPVATMISFPVGVYS